jgi:hypothetical protein
VCDIELDFSFVMNSNIERWLRKFLPGLPSARAIRQPKTRKKKERAFFLEKQGTLPGSIMNNETTASLHQHSQPQSNENKSRN